MKPPDSRNAKKSVTFSYFPGKNSQQLRFQSPKLIYSQFKATLITCILKKISSESDFPIKNY